MARIKTHYTISDKWCIVGKSYLVYFVRGAMKINSPEHYLDNRYIR